MNQTLGKPASLWRRVGVPLATGVLLAACGSGGAAPVDAPPPEALRDAPPPAVLEPVRTDREPRPILPDFLDTIQAGAFDNGKMWTFDHPPADYMRVTYGFEPGMEWFDRARLGSVRISGCSASFVSPNGLIMTNNHCAREDVTAASEEGEDLLTNGFYATTLEEERQVGEEFFADVLMEIRDVTEEVYATLEGVEDDQERAQARQEAIEEIEARFTEEFGGEDGGYLVEVINMYNGGLYSAYIFRQYTNAKLVMAPEEQVAYFGGDYDNFTYPRYDLDISFYRIYDENDQPLRSENYFPFDRDGVEEGDLVFVIGNPGATTRLQTVAELEFRRDVQEPAVLGLFQSRAEAYQVFSEADPEGAEEADARNQIFSFLNAAKSYGGRVEGLNDPIVLARRRDQERKFQAALERSPALSAEYGDLIPRMAELQRQKMGFAPGFRGYLAMANPAFDAAVLVRAVYGYRYVASTLRGAPPEALEGVKEAFLAVESQPSALDEQLLIARLQQIADAYGADSQVMQDILEGRTIEGMAAVVMERSDLADSAQAASKLESGSLAVTDPALRLAGALFPSFLTFNQGTFALQTEEGEIASQIGRARFQVYGTDQPPDATFSLRISDGVVKGFEYNGTIAPVYTTFYGMYDHHYSYGPDSDWTLPDRWLPIPEGLDLSTPLNFVSTADIIGGNSGSPVVNREMELVGIAFDGNIESLPGDYIYMDAKNRTVSVDARGILEALTTVYHADRLYTELTTGRLGGN